MPARSVYVFERNLSAWNLMRLIASLILWCLVCWWLIECSNVQIWLNSNIPNEIRNEFRNEQSEFSGGSISCGLVLWLLWWSRISNGSEVMWKILKWMNGKMRWIQLTVGDRYGAKVSGLRYVSGRAFAQSTQQCLQIISTACFFPLNSQLPCTWCSSIVENFQKELSSFCSNDSLVIAMNATPFDDTIKLCGKENRRNCSQSCYKSK